MEINYYAITIESDSGVERVVWEWSVTSDEGKSLSGIEISEFLAKFFITIACIRFLFTKAGR